VIERTPVATPKRILVVGSGGREHALAWKLAAEAGVEQVVAAPGNAGMARSAALSTDLRFDDQATGIRRLAESEQTDLVVIGPEGPLVGGLVDALAASGIATFGPTGAAARIEGSKAFCREIAESADVPMAQGRAFESASEAIAYARTLGGPVAVKADGLASGKGVWVCEAPDEVASAVGRALALPVFNAERPRVVVERALRGREVSVIAICDSTTALALPAARDHKRLDEGDTGPNTGGMGAYSPVDELAHADVAAIVEQFHLPVLRALQERGTPFRGALFAGLMLTHDGPRLLEFNARFGDPEAQVVLPRVAAPLAPLLLAAVQDRLSEVADALGIHGRVLPSTSNATVGVVLAAPGYPERPEVGAEVAGIEAAESVGALVFCAGVRQERGGLVTSGGRVLTVVGTGSSIDAAAGRAYAAADHVTFLGKRLRRDIGRMAVAA
jgi:phosphoribosylamine--glycine ligase